jgi:hypothetical protein
LADSGLALDASASGDWRRRRPDRNGADASLRENARF